MTKNFLLEQCNRGRAVTNDELVMHKSNNDTWWINHQEGHLKFISSLEEILEKYDNTIDKKSLRKWFKKVKNVSNNIIEMLDEKYPDFDDKMTEEDERIYSFQDGITCELASFKSILNERHHYNKASYKITDWIKLGLINN